MPPKPPEEKQEHDENSCPECGSKKLSGLMGSFWVELDEDGWPKGQWQDWESETELSAERLCRLCGWDSRR